jgi:ribosomal protein L22
MSAEDEKDEGTPAQEPQAKQPAAKKPAAKKPAAKKPAAKKAADDEPMAQTEDKPPAEKKPAKAKKAPKAAAEQPAQAPAKEAAAAKEAPVEEPADEPTPAAKRKPAAARRRAVHAHARYVRTSARKARMVCGHIRGKSVQEARAILAFTPRDVARDWSKLLESAVANAENNHELVEDDLIVHEAYADEGPTIKRFRPRAMGRATPIRKRTSHLTITLTPRS